MAASVAQADPRASLVRRLAMAAAALLGVVIVGSLGYHQIGGGRWAYFDCLYMTMITLSTVGYGETLAGMDSIGAARIWTVCLIVLGSGTLVYSASTLTAFIVEGELLGALRGRRMQKAIDQLRDHFVVCGVGTTGHHVIHELLATKRAFVAVDRDAERLRRLAEEHGAEMLYVVGDATEDLTLAHAGIDRAAGVIAALTDDRDNLYVTVTARALSAKARIIAKAVELGAEAKLKRAGADAAVSPNLIGGMRMVSLMVRPAVVEFLDLMLRDKDQSLRIEQLPVVDKMVGAQLRDSGIRDLSDALVLALRKADGSHVFNPRPNVVLEAGTTLIVLARTDDVVKLRQAMASGSLRPMS